MSKPVVFVIGASGNVGSATVTSLSAKYADKVEIRAGVRNPEKAEKLKALSNVAVVQATMGDSNLVNVFAGVSTLYIVTPGAEDRAQLAISTAESAKQAGVKHIAVVSLPIVGVDVLFGRQFTELEEKVSNLGVPYTFVRLPMFMENVFMFKSTIAAQGAMFNPTDPDKPLKMATVEDMGRASAGILVNPEKYTNKAFDIVSYICTYNDIIKALSEALGKEIKYVRVPYEELKKNMGGRMAEWQAQGMFELFQLVDSSHPSVSQGDMSYYQKITGEEPTSLKQWATKYSGAFQ